MLVTGYDILFFWVARMIMAGLRFTGKAPFSIVHLHGLVRVGGEKMSKTRGNVIDPLEAIAEFGADAVRFTLASAAASGPTVSVERSRMAGSRNFATKLWNAARFTLGQLDGGRPAGQEPAAGDASGPLDPVAPLGHRGGRQPAPRRVPVRRGGGGGVRSSSGTSSVTDTWRWSSRSCPDARRTPRRAARRTAASVLARCLSDSLALLHPFMPFVTEEIWEKLTGRPGTLIVAAYPQGDPAFRDEPAEKIVEAAREVVTRVRNFRSERGFPPTEPVRLAIDPDSPERELVEQDRGRSLRSSSTWRGFPTWLSRRRIPGCRAMSWRGSSVGLSVAEQAGAGDYERVARQVTALDEEIAELSAKLQQPLVPRQGAGGRSWTRRAGGWWSSKSGAPLSPREARDSVRRGESSRHGAGARSRT